MNKKTVSFLALLLAVLVFAGCGKSNVPSAADHAVRQVTEAASRIVESLPPELKGEIPDCEAVFVGVEKQPCAVSYVPARAAPDVACMS